MPLVQRHIGYANIQSLHIINNYADMQIILSSLIFSNDFFFHWKAYSVQQAVGFVVHEETESGQTDNCGIFLCLGERASLYNLVNKAKLVHNLFLVCLFLVYLSISTCFGRLCANHQEKHLCLCDTCYLLFCMDSCLVCRAHSAYQTVIHTE